jgi:hypothetical protein
MSLRDFYRPSSPTIDPLLFVVPLRAVADDTHEQESECGAAGATVTTSNSVMTVCRMGRAVSLQPETRVAIGSPLWQTFFQARSIERLDRRHFQANNN